MSTYLVFAPPQSTPPDEASKVLADRLAPLALLAPVLWLVFNRLWVEAVLALLLSVVAGVLLESGTWFWPGVALTVAISVVTGLEGRNWRAASLTRKGWQLVDLVEADDADTAFAIHANRLLHQSGSAMGPMPAHRSHPVRRPVTQPLGQIDDGAIGLVPVERT